MDASVSRMSVVIEHYENISDVLSGWEPLLDLKANISQS